MSNNAIPRKMCALFGMLAMVWGMATGCSDPTGSGKLPTGIPDPASFDTPLGAVGMRNAGIAAFASVIPFVIVATGLLTDELQTSTVGATGNALLTSGPLGGPTALDERIAPESSPCDGVCASSYEDLQGARATLHQALGALAKYADATPGAYRTEVYALRGYTKILLADLFCSGVPLSTVDFDRDYTYRAGSTTAEVYSNAIIDFDSALAVNADSVRMVNLARIGKARALLDLGRFQEAAQMVAAVPTDFQYQLAIQWNPAAVSQNILTANSTVADREGRTGVAYISSADSRTTVTTTEHSSYGAPLYFPTKYQRSGYSQFTVADGIEARLIEAEANLHAGGTQWLKILNTLRMTAIIPALDTLIDPVSDTARVTMVFTERAKWLFLTAHRQGDLRRLVRSQASGGYGRLQQNVYPSGSYLARGRGIYGSDVTAPISSNELLNPLYRGCLNRAP